MVFSFEEVEKATEERHKEYLRHQSIADAKKAAGECYCVEGHAAAKVYIPSPNKVLCNSCADKIEIDEYNHAARLLKGWREESLYPSP